MALIRCKISVNILLHSAQWTTVLDYCRICSPVYLGSTLIIGAYCKSLLRGRWLGVSFITCSSHWKLQIADCILTITKNTIAYTSIFTLQQFQAVLLTSQSTTIRFYQFTWFFSSPGYHFVSQWQVGGMIWQFVAYCHLVSKHTENYWNKKTLLNGG